MIQNKKVLAIIPARAGSKRVKNKNLRELGGKPLIAWTIEAAKKSKYIDHIYVSTDSKDIQKVAYEYQVDADPLREEALSGDHAKTSDVVFDIIENKKTGFDIVVLLQPTSPLRQASDIDGALELYFEKNAKSVVSVCETETPLSWCTYLDETLKLDELVQNLEQKRSQDIKKSYQLNGAVYVSSVESFINNQNFYYSDGAVAFVMTRERSVDIDTEENMSYCKFVMENK